MQHYRLVRIQLPFRRVALVALILFGTAGCDQATKHWARQALDHDSVEVFGGLAQLVLTENRGGLLSLGADLPDYVRTAVFTGVLVALAATVIWLVMYRRGTYWDAAALALVLGGGLGNLVDRVMRFGAVTDFVILKVGPVRTGIFNVADVCLMAGMLMILTLSSFQRRSTSNDGERP